MLTTSLTKDTQSALDNATRTDNGSWHINGTGLVGGKVYDELCGAYAQSSGLLVELFGGGITVTPEHPAYRDLMKINGQVDPA